jgi:hypothetical protein
VKHRNPILADMNTRKQHHIRKNMVCSPAVGGIKIEQSCYTPHILTTIRDAYNKDHSSQEHIRETDPVKIWSILNERLVHCQKEDCWLNQIKDEALRKKIDRYIFAPDRPYEWNKNPNAWLSNYDILNVLEQYENTPEYKHFEFIGPTPIDFDAILPQKKCVYNDLCHFNLAEQMKHGKTKIGVVFNLDKHDQSGSHWVSLFIDMDERFVFFFDSAGSGCPKPIRELVSRVRKQAQKMGIKLHFFQNYPKVHQYSNTECGVYSLFFIITMLTGKTNYQENMTFQDKLNLFKKHRIPDKYIEKYRYIYFNQ